MVDATRREWLSRMGLALATLPLANVLGCGASGGAEAGRGGDGGLPDATPDAAPNATADAAPDGAPDTAPAATPDATPDAAPAARWATGGTAAMRGDYGDPFAAGLGATCTLYCASTRGPCYVDTVERRDISEGQPGVPMRLAFKVVDVHCTPIAGATIDVWHTSATGLYSGQEAVDLCTLGDASARAGRWFRGVQTTDAAGRVDFDSCFPGWYRGRTLHLHFTVRVSGGQGVTSQLFFDDALSDDILGSQPVYLDQGPRDTTNTDDSVVAADAVRDYLLQTRRAPDGALVAWKALVVLGTTDGERCTIPRGPA